VTPPKHGRNRADHGTVHQTLKIVADPPAPVPMRQQGTVGVAAGARDHAALTQPQEPPGLEPVPGMPAQSGRAELRTWPTQRLLTTAARLTEHRCNQVLVPLHLTVSSFAALAALAQSGPVPQTALADLLRVAAQSTGKVLVRLEADGYVTRKRGPFDRRSTKVAITSKGRAALQAAEEATAGLVSDGDGHGELRERLIDLISAMSETSDK
jgi:MarR family transcriptional regulator, organic hydroperoxide resistance regulator